MKSATESAANVQRGDALDEQLDRAQAQISTIVLDKADQVKLALTCLLAGGHLLLQDLPGMGKTTLAETLAKTLGLGYRRVQFTSDMLPADIIGVSMYRADKGEFTFKSGPVFTQLLLADEINRSSPKTQSALLEAMEERQVSVDGKTYQLPSPFFVIATQNPFQQTGVYPLPESQLDRFLMCLSLGYPTVQAERELLEGVDRRDLLAQLTAVFDSADILTLQKHARSVFVSDPVLDYIQRLVAKTRQSSNYHGLSTRAAIALKRAAQAYAFVGGFKEVSPEDVQAIFEPVANHRLQHAHDIGMPNTDSNKPLSIAGQIMAATTVIV